MLPSVLSFTSSKMFLNLWLIFARWNWAKSCNKWIKINIKSEISNKIIIKAFRILNPHPSKQDYHQERLDKSIFNSRTSVYSMLYNIWFECIYVFGEKHTLGFLILMWLFICWLYKVVVYFHECIQLRAAEGRNLTHCHNM